MYSGLKSKWIAALRSGEYKQGQEKLKNMHGEYCCLGVLLDISDEFEWDAENEQFFTKHEHVIRYAAEATDYGMNPYQGQLHLEDEEFPEWLRSYFSIASPDHSTLIHMNDVDGMSFKEIAEYIEEKVK